MTLKFGFGLQAFDHPVVQIANQNLAHYFSYAIKKDSMPNRLLQVEFWDLEWAKRPLLVLRELDATKQGYAQR
jgi:hypothetical protein